MTTTTSALPPAWAGLLDDAALFPPGDAEMGDAVAGFLARREEWYADLVASFVVTDVRFGEVEEALPVSLVITTGAGGILGATQRVHRSASELVGVEIALRDLDDLAGNARRVVAAVDAARAEGTLPEETRVFVELPQQAPGAGWLAAADEVAAADLRLKFRTGGVEAHLFPSEGELAAWIDAALERETGFKCTAGLHQAVRHTGADTFEHHGFVNVLLAVRRSFDGGTPAEVAEILADRDADAVAAAAREADLAGARRWFTSQGSCSVSEPLDDLLALGLLEAPVG